MPDNQAATDSHVLDVARSGRRRVRRHQPPSRFRAFVRRHRGLVFSIAGIVGALLLFALIAIVILMLLLGNITRVPLTISDAVRPDQDDSVNILLLGADAGQERTPNSRSILEDAAADTWPRGKYRSDATMLLHIDNDRRGAYVVSIPRDSYVDLYDERGAKQESSKINAALSLYGPSGAVSTVENLTNLRVDHLVLVDWDGFQDITDALGGVRITTKTEGTRVLDGREALTYVRERYTLPGGDFGRVKRQQNFLRSIMTGIIDRGTLTNPLKLRRTLDAITQNVAVEHGWSSAGIQSLAFSMRNIRPADVTFMTVPTRGTGSDPVAGSIVVVNKQRSDKLWEAMKQDDVASFVERYPDDVLGPPTEVD